LPPRPTADVPSFPPGVLNVDKAAGETSFAVVNRLRRLTGAHRVGHAGTLDPLATGVLPILFESATRLAEFALRLEKTYVADIHLGYTTATDDAEAEREPVGDPGRLTADDLTQALTAFSGRILQEPPAFSAVKVDGKRAYKLARQGEDPRPKAREVEVYEVRLLEFTPGSKVHYHGLTAHWTLGVLIEAVTGRDFRDVIRETVAEPLGLGRELYVGLPESEFARTADMHEPTAKGDGYQPSAEPNTADWRRGGAPGGAGYGTARAMAALYQMMLAGGELNGTRIISPLSFFHSQVIVSGGPCGGSHLRAASDHFTGSPGSSPIIKSPR